MFLIYSLSRVGLSVAEVKHLHDQGCPDLQRAASEDGLVVLENPSRCFAQSGAVCFKYSDGAFVARTRLASGLDRRP